MTKTQNILIFLFLTCLTAYGQKEWNNWYFGENAGLSFNTPDGVPIAVSNGSLFSEEGCSSLSDDKGALLFYSDGMTIFNRVHTIFPSGAGLAGNNNSTQSSLLIRKPGSKSIYYLITTDFGPGTNGCRYSEIDLTLDNGFGNITYNKNIQLFSASTEKLTSVKHSNGKDWWIIGHQQSSDVFRSYLVTASGINQSPVISIAGKPLSDNVLNNKGYLKASRYGNKLALAATGDGFIEIFNFNNSTGVIDSKSVLINSPSLQNVYGIEFSPDGSKLYASRFEPSSAIFQFDLNEPPSQIINSQLLIFEKDENYSIGALQLGPDNKIYVAKIGSTYLGRINHPDISGKGSTYIDSSISLNNRKCRFGLPNCYSMETLKIEFKSNTPLCAGDSLFLECNNIFGADYKWNGPGGFTSNLYNPAIYLNSDTLKGFYKVTITIGGIVISDSIYLDVSTKPDFTLSSSDSTILCPGDSTLLKASTMEQNLKFRWSTGQASQEIYVKKPGIYSVSAVNLSGCTTTKQIEVSFFDFEPKIKTLGPTILCNGDSVHLMVQPYSPDYKLKWSTGESTKQITVKKSQHITLDVESTQGCKSKDSIDIVVYDKLNAKIESNISPPFCSGDTIELRTNLMSSDISYKWSTGDTTPVIKISKPGYYNVILEANGNCTDSTSFFAPFTDKPDISIIAGNKTSFCDGDFVNLSASSSYTGFLKYYWNTGDSTQTIKVF